MISANFQLISQLRDRSVWGPTHLCQRGLTSDWSSDRAFAEGCLVCGFLPSWSVLWTYKDPKVFCEIPKSAAEKEQAWQYVTFLSHIITTAYSPHNLMKILGHKSWLSL